MYKLMINTKRIPDHKKEDKMPKIKCPVCDGTGKCQSCHGANVQCVCNGKNKCSYCGGTGTVKM